MSTCSAVGAGSGVSAAGATGGAAGFAVFTSRGGGSAGAAGFAGSGALPCGGFFPFTGAGVSANEAFDGTLSPR